MPKKIKSITIQPKQLGASLPYPYHIEMDGSVARQDFWNGKPEKLLGFNKLPESGDMSDKYGKLVMLKDFLEEPERAIGMYPVFKHAEPEDDGEGGTNWYTYQVPIESVRVNRK